MSYKTNLPASRTGTNVATGYLGQINFSGTAQRSGTGGFTFSNRTTTAMTTSNAQIISLTLTRGIYLISYKLRQCRTGVNFGQTVGFTSYLSIGSTSSVENGVSSGYSNEISGDTYFGTSNNTLVATITSDSVVVSVYGSLLQNFSISVATNEMWALRIA